MTSLIVVRKSTVGCCWYQIKDLLANLKTRQGNGKDAGSSGGGGLKAKLTGGAAKRQETAPAA